MKIWLSQPSKRVWSGISAALCVSIALSACHPSGATKTTVKTTNFNFGVQQPSGSIVPETDIPYKWGQTYGWSLNVEPKDVEVHWKEVLTKPASDSKSGDSAKYGDNVITIEKDEVPKNGSLSNLYAIAPGDPKGQYSIVISINGQTVKNVDFKLDDAGTSAPTKEK